jgi:hypothetical protein
MGSWAEWAKMASRLGNGFGLPGDSGLKLTWADKRI